MTVTVRHGIDGPNRNRWFTVLENGGSFHSFLLTFTRGYVHQGNGPMIRGYCTTNQYYMEYHVAKP